MNESFIQLCAARPGNGATGGDEESNAGKVRVHFKAVAGAPILKKNKFLIPSSEPFGTVRIQCRVRLSQRVTRLLV